MILTEKRYYYDGTNYVIIEVKTKGTKYYRIFLCNTRKRLSGRCMKMLYEQYSKLFQISPALYPLYSPVGRAYYYSEEIRSVRYTKKGGFYYGISSSTL